MTTLQALRAKEEATQIEIGYLEAGGYFKGWDNALRGLYMKLSQIRRDISELQERGYIY